MTIWWKQRRSNSASDMGCLLGPDRHNRCLDFAEAGPSTKHGEDEVMKVSNNTNGSDPNITKAECHRIAEHHA